MGGPAALVARRPPHRLHLRSRRRRQHLDHERRRQRQAPGDQGGVPPAQPADLVPDGRFIVAKKHFTTGRSLGTGEVWLYQVSGGGGVQLVKRANEKLQKELGEPIYAADGKSIYYTRNVTPGHDLRICAGFEHRPVRHRTLRYRHRRGDDRGHRALGGSVRPTPSPDGKQIAFVRRERAKSKLYVKDLDLGRGAQDLRRARPGRAGDLGGHRRLSQHGVDARRQVGGVLGGRQDPPRRRRRRERAR